MSLESIFPVATELPAEFAAPSTQCRILINGEIIDWTGARKEVVSPLWLRSHRDEPPSPTTLGYAPHVDADVALRALDAAYAAWQLGAGRWPTMRVEERIEAVEHFVERMQAQREPICRLLMWEIAKTWPEVQNEFDRTIKYIRDTIDALKDLDRQNSRLQFKEGVIAQVRRSPLGVTLCMGPFNYPLNETFTTLIPTLIMGNPAVVKLPRYGVLFWDLLLEPFRDCFPPGVVNMLDGDGREIVPPMMRTGKIDVLAFIGSARAANSIKAAHPHLNRLRGILGLDAKNPALILPDADLAHTVTECVRGALTFNGQRCTALKIIFVHENIVGQFTEQLAAAVDRLPIAFPWINGVKLTPLPETNKPARMHEYVDDALAHGAKLVNQGNEFYATAYHPAVLSGVTSEMKIFHEEQFGPVVPIVTYRDPQEFIDYVVNSSYGQQASIFGQDSATIGRLIDVLANQVCRINLNTQSQRGPDIFPFTGRKDSAEGTLSISDALRCFSIRSMVAAPQNEFGKQVVKSIIDGGYSNFLNTDIIM